MTEGKAKFRDGKVCQACGEEDDIVEVWDDLEDYESNGPPDYVGCYSCQEMFAIGSDS